MFWASIETLEVSYLRNLYLCSVQCYLTICPFFDHFINSFLDKKYDMGGLNNFQQYFTAIQKIESESELNIFLSKNQKQIAESFSKAIRLVWSEYEAEQIQQQV